MDDNTVTLNSYGEHIQDYINGTPQNIDEATKHWLDLILHTLPKDSKILELGSGFGRDAEYIETQGFKVMRTDASKGFVELLKNKGHEARLLNAITDDFGGGLDMIFANAVFLHFNRARLSEVIIKAYDSLKTGGVLAFSVKKGDGEEWSDQKLGAPRYFCYWQTKELEAILKDAGFSGYDILDVKGN